MSGAAWRALARFALGALLVLAAAACTFNFERPAAAVPKTYDFGPPVEYARVNPSVPGTVLVAAVRAPVWLADEGIVYRLLYDEAARPRIYAYNRWAGAPADLIADRIRSRLVAVSRGVVGPTFSARSDYTLRVELEDFSHHFEAPGQARAVLRARASLLESDRRTLLAQRAFEVARPAAPNAEGAVKALTEATDAFIEELVKWTAENARKGEK